MENSSEFYPWNLQSDIYIWYKLKNSMLSLQAEILQFCLKLYIEMLN